MIKVQSAVRYMTLLLAMALPNCHGEIIFGNEESRLVVEQPAFFDATGEQLSVTGTLSHDVAHETISQAINFSYGTIEKSGQNSSYAGDKVSCVLRGEYKIDSDGDIVYLSGSDILRASPGFTIEKLSVSGASNTIVGAPSFANNIELPTNVNLTCQLTAPLNRNIQVDGGTVTLAGDLACANEFAVVGNGAINCNGYTYQLARRYNSPLSGNLSYADGNIALKGATSIAGTWTFSGSSVVDGNHEDFNLATTGVISIAANSTLVLKDVTLRNVRNNSIVFADATSVLKLDGAVLQLTESVATTTGKMVASKNDSTIMLYGFDWTFSGTSKVTVDGVRLWLQTYTHDTLPEPGNFKLPEPVFVNHTYINDNVVTNTTTGNLEYLNNGIIAEVGEYTGNELIGTLRGDLFLRQSSLLGPTDVIKVAESLEIDGRGAKVLFANPDNPQLLVQEGVTLTLKDVELAGLRNGSIKIEEGGKIAIKDKVIFTLSEDVTFAEESIEMVGDSDTLTIRGDSTPHMLKFNSTPSGTYVHLYEYTKHLKLGTNSLKIENARLYGLRHISYTTGSYDAKSLSGAIVLAGNATVEVDEPLIDHRLIVTGLNNRFSFLHDNITFDGSLTFSDTGANVLSIDFAFTSVNGEVPELFFGADALRLDSALGQAALVFDDFDVVISNNAASSFKAGLHGSLIGNNLTVKVNPILQTNKLFTLGSTTVLNSPLSAGAIALDDALIESMRGLMDRRTIEQLLVPTSAFDEEQLALLDARCPSEAKRLLIRAVQLPDPTSQTVLNYGSAFKLPVLSGNIVLRETKNKVYSNFALSAENAVNVTLQDGVGVAQSDADLNIKAADIINVVGGTVSEPNEILLRGDATVSGKILVDDNAILRIQFDEKTATSTCTFAADSELEFGQDSTVVFAGRGTIVLPENFDIALNAAGAKLIIRDEATVLISGSKVVSMSGVGTVEISRSGQLVVEQGAHLVVGVTTDDKIEFDVTNSGLVRVGSAFESESNVAAKISFVRGDHTIDANRMGMFLIGYLGDLEINALDGELLRSGFTGFDISAGGQLYIASSGKLVMGANSSVKDDYSLNTIGGYISGTGTVGLVETEFFGKIQPVAVAQSAVSVDQFVSYFAQTGSALSQSTLFVGADGISRVYTKNKQIVALDSNERIVDDNSDGDVHGYNIRTGKRFTITANGERV